MTVSGISGINFSSTEATNEYFALLDTLTKYGNNSEGLPPLLYGAEKEILMVFVSVSDEGRIHLSGFFNLTLQYNKNKAVLTRSYLKKRWIQNPPNI